MGLKQKRVLALTIILNLSVIALQLLFLYRFCQVAVYRHANDINKPIAFVIRYTVPFPYANGDGRYKILFTVSSCASKHLLNI